MTGLSGTVAERYAPRSLELARLTWPEVEQALDRGWKTAVVVGGALEGHGPHLPLGTDVCWGRELGLRVARGLGSALVAPVLPFGPDEGLMSFPGTVHVDEELSAALLLALARSLRAHGFDTVVACTSHEGWFRPLRALRGALAGLVCVCDLDALFGAIRRVADAEGVGSAELGAHAGEFETSVALAVDPTAVRAPLPRGTLVDLDAHPNLFRTDVRSHAPDGVIGDPRRASGERGERYLDALAELICAEVRAAGSADLGA